jgi:hypothetical protein
VGQNWRRAMTYQDLKLLKILTGNLQNINENIELGLLDTNYAEIVDILETAIEKWGEINERSV